MKSAKKIYNNCPSRFDKLKNLIRGHSLRIIVSSRVALKSSHMSDLSNCLGNNCELPSAKYFMDGTYFRYTWQLHILDELKFKDNIGKFNEKHSNIFILIMEKDRFSRKYLSILIANIIGIIGIIIALVK